ncbi:hypothetical protein GF312_00130, partial [Candidatus Poribacteria bacterium]|nr:hypothetical protein [Candidatus Poribacteria bacterium]
TIPDDVMLSIKTFTYNGGGLIGFHDILSTSLSKVFGGIGGVGWHESLNGEYELIIYDKDHPIVKGIPSKITILNEEHVYSRCDPKAHNILNFSFVTKENKIQTYRAAWTCRFGKGKTFAFMLAHRESTRYNPYIIKMVANAIRWMKQKE